MGTYRLRERERMALVPYPGLRCHLNDEPRVRSVILVVAGGGVGGRRGRASPGTIVRIVQ